MHKDLDLSLKNISKIEGRASRGVRYSVASLVGVRRRFEDA